MRAKIIAAIVLAAALAGPSSVGAAPMTPLAALDAPPVRAVAFRGGNWRDHPMMYGDYWREHQREWDAFEGRGAPRASASCARFRSYDRATQTYVNRNGRRVACP